MSGFAGALLPIILIVGIGRFVGWKGWITPEGWRAIERISYIILLPALIVRALATAPFENAPWEIMASLIGAQVFLGLIGLSAHPSSSHNRPAIGSIIQSNVRWNTFVALSLGGSLFGAEGIALVSLAAAAMIPAANVLSVYALMSHAETAGLPRRRPLVALIRNPLVIACVIGGAVGALNMPLHTVADDTLRIMGQAAIALGLLSAGAGVDLSALKRAGLTTLIWSVIRLLGLPLFAIAIALTLGLTGTPLFIVLICAATPTATNGYILSRELGGDAPLSANLIAVQTLLAMLTLPLLWFILLQFTSR